MINDRELTLVAKLLATNHVSCGTLSGCDKHDLGAHTDIVGANIPCIEEGKDHAQRKDIIKLVKDGHLVRPKSAGRV